MSEWTHALPKRPCSIKAKAPHCASLWRFSSVTLSFQMAVSVRRSISCCVHVSVHSLPLKAVGHHHSGGVRAQVARDLSLPEDAQA